MTSADGGAPDGGRVRVYDAIRTAHLERFREFTPATVVYADVRYDFDRSLADGLDLRPLGRWATARLLFRTSHRAVELNEPLMTYRWLDLALQLAAVRLGGLLRRRRARVGAYCISLTDPAEKLQARLRLPHRVARWWAALVLGRLVRRYDRLAFGTDATRDLVASYVGPDVLADRSRVFPAVAAACDCASTVSRDPSLVLFVGAFDERKGIRQLLAAWDHRTADGAPLRLRLIGTGALTDVVTAWARERADVEVVIDPPREEIHRAYREAHVVVLLSQRIRYWREQVGLPIVEALSHGCEVVTTAETGLAGWLADHGHTVVAADADAATIAHAVTTAAAARRTAADVVAPLPTVDSRWAADRWLLADD